MSAPIQVAIVGGSGFMGYDLARTLHESPDFEPTVFSTSAKSLVNLARHDIPVELVRYQDLRHMVLEKNVAFLVNYAHPFGNREALSIASQLEILSDFMINNLERNPALRAMHISSMSVYEPFAATEEFDESTPIRAPRSDRYARSKCAFEAKLDAHCELRDRLLILRPTVVYGPFCRPWTDALLGAFEAGDIDFHDLGGRIQPLHVGDVSHFIIDRFNDFAPGTFNLAGPDTLPWHDFINFFGNVVARGRLVEHERNQAESVSTARAAMRTVLELIGMNLRQPRVKEIVRPLAAHLPAGLIEDAKHRFIDNLGALARNAGENAQPAGAYCDPFFAQDRLVSMKKTHERFPDLALTALESTRDVMSRYHRFRFRDEVLT